MNPGKIGLAAIVGGIAMFAWGAISHMALPIGEMGFQSLPAEAEAKLIPPMRSEIKSHGFYFFPGIVMKNATDEQTKAWEAKVKEGPQGILIYQPAGGEVMPPTQLLKELASNLLAALFLAFVLAHVHSSFGTRLAIGAAVGLFGWAALSLSYWNWYFFP